MPHCGLVERLEVLGRSSGPQAGAFRPNKMQITLTISPALLDRIAEVVRRGHTCTRAVDRQMR